MMTQFCFVFFVFNEFESINLVVDNTNSWLYLAIMMLSLRIFKLIGFSLLSHLFIRIFVDCYNINQSFFIIPFYHFCFFYYFFNSTHYRLSTKFAP